MKNNIIKKILNYFFKGLLFVAPIAATFYVLYWIFIKVDSMLEFDIPGLGLLVILAGITFLGYLSSLYFTNPLVAIFEDIIERAPLLKLIYSSVKDLLSAFVGEKKRFNKPVLVTVSKETNLQKLGFITQEDLSEIGIKEKVAVYLPHSYNFSGNLFIVPRENITPIDVSGTDIMKFIVSGGVSDISEDHHAQK